MRSSAPFRHRMPCLTPILRTIALLGAVWMGLPIAGVVAETAAAPDAQAGEAMRLLKKNCLSCHNEEKKKGGLVMTTREALLAGGEDGAVLVPGAPDKSPLIASLEEDADPHMPPKKQLSASQVDLLKRWIQGGATWKADALTAAAGPRPVSLAPAPASYHPVLAMALSPDSQRLAVACGSTVQIYDVREKEPALLGRATAHLDPVQSVAWSPDGKLLATGAFRRVIIWNTEPLAVQREITSGLTDRVAAVKFLTKGTDLILADGLIAESGIVRIVDAGDGSITRSWTAHADTIFDLAVSADGKLLATAGGDKLVKVWDLTTQTEVAKLEGHVAQVLTLAFNPDATQLVTGGADHELKLWDLKTRERIGTLGTHTDAINGLTWSAAGPALLAVTNSGSILRYTDFKSHNGTQSSESAQERKLEAADGTLYCVAATADGQRVFAGTYDGRLFAWNKDGKVTTKLDCLVVNSTATAAK